ncbi:TPA: protoheme IX biogenesis protein HemY [Morganella morganii]|uniref:heme biosynthesis HemY N-terminal domain-containing protein n=1 Tax=Morganella morganii TaxID=582 RepID=UPI00091D9BDF|nr:heme biosynthesis HemY N-terminal domain-containing protein [Morganella morganii]SHM88832.1 HemY protein [Morganella morganii]HCE8948219.1 protoheme IX biogenesis protein HemY [Morganella morganii]
MFKVFILFLILIAGIIIGPLVAGHQGYVLIQTDNFDIETSVTGLVICFLGLQAVLMLLGWCWRRLKSGSSRTLGWFGGHKRNRARALTNDALLKLAEGDFRQVEKLLSRSADNAEQPLVNYLLAAEAAQQRSDNLRANQYLERASELAGRHQLPVDITRARILLSRDEIPAARTAIDNLLEIAPRHPEVLRLAEQVYARSGAWKSLIAILPQMKKSGEFTDEQVEQTEIRAWLGMMQQVADQDGSDALRHWWKNLSRHLRHNPDMAVAAAQHFIAGNDMADAEAVVLDGLKRQKDQRLLMLLPQIRTDNPKAIRKVLNQMQKEDADQPLLNSTLGQLAMQETRWEDAEKYFKSALSARQDTHDAAWLADVLDKQKKYEESAMIRRNALLNTLTLPDEKTPRE